ncbi:MAG: hypothetical protein RLZZ387_2801 [Chloroflexota bacterium]|jgi:hypothetical protein
MLDSPARVWERAGEVLLSPPEPCRPFIDALRARCPGARYSSIAWMVPQAHGTTAVDLLRTFFPVVQDSRPNAAPAPAFDDGVPVSAFARLDLVPVLTPVAPALLAFHNDRHEARSRFSEVAAVVPDIPASLGLAEGLEGRWMHAYAAARFWQELHDGFSQVVQSEVQPDGSLCEHLDPEAIRTYWLTTRERLYGVPPELLGQRWFPPQSTLPIWVAALLACVEGSPFMLDETTNAAIRTLPPWPLRRPAALHRLDLKDAAHWPVSLCVLPDKLSRDGNEALLHLSAVNGVSKNKALWAAILDGRREQIPVRAGRQRYYPRRVEGRNQYVSDWNDEPLPASGLSHLALTHRTAFEPELGQAFLHLAGNDLAGAPDLPLFAQQLSRSISVPFNLAWAAQLWSYGTNPDDSETALITPLPSLGCQGYWVLADEPRWTRLIIAVQRGMSPSALSEDDLVVTEVGASTRIDEVVEQAGEGGDDDDESE